MSKHANEGNLTGLLEELDREIEGDISLGDILEHFNSRGFGPLLVLPALLVLLPTGAIPGVPTTCALFIVLTAALATSSLVCVQQPTLANMYHSVHCLVFVALFIFLCTRTMEDDSEPLSGVRLFSDTDDELPIERASQRRRLTAPPPVSNSITSQLGLSFVL